MNTYFHNILTGDRPYIIAEIGVNHGGNIKIAEQMISEAAESGADAVKFQTYKASSLASKNSPAYWDVNEEPTPSQYELFRKYDSFGKEEYLHLSRFCREVKIRFLSTPFDFESADYLSDMMDIIKVSSSDITNKPFLDHIASIGKPVLLSTGASTLDEVKRAVEWVLKHNSDLGLLHCVLMYPTPDECANLSRISVLSEVFPDFVIGYSDHTLPGRLDPLVYAWKLGARILEKHFTFDKSLPGNDHYHAMDKNDLALLHKRLKENFSQSEIEASVLYGNKSADYQQGEEPARLHARRSIVLKNDLPEGHVLSAEDLCYKRPAHGIPPWKAGEVKGQVLKCKLSADTILKEEHIRLQ